MHPARTHPAAHAVLVTARRCTRVPAQVHAARCNLPTARAILSDGWGALPRRPRFQWIVSNPPVHLGVQPDFRIVRSQGRHTHARSGPGEIPVPPPAGGAPLRAPRWACAPQVRTLIAGAARRLRAGGTLWLVAQTYVPLRTLLEAQRGLCDPRAAYDDGRFTVWTATRAPRRRAAAGEREQTESRTSREQLAQEPAARKRKRT